MSKKIDLAAATVKPGSGYRDPFHTPCMAQSYRKPGLHADLTAFGVNLTTFAPGVWSSQRHWRSHEDEFVRVVEGGLVVVTDSGEGILRAGDCAAFRKGDPDGHHLINRTDRSATVLEIGNASPLDVCTCSDIDLMVAAWRAGIPPQGRRALPGTGLAARVM